MSSYHNFPEFMGISDSALYLLLRAVGILMAAFGVLHKFFQIANLD